MRHVLFLFLISIMIISCGKSSMDQPLSTSSNVENISKQIESESASNDHTFKCGSICSSHYESCKSQALLFHNEWPLYQGSQVKNCETVKNDCQSHCEFCNNVWWDKAKPSKSIIESSFHCVAAEGRHPYDGPCSFDYKYGDKYCMEYDYQQ